MDWRPTTEWELKSRVRLAQYGQRDVLGVVTGIREEGGTTIVTIDLETPVRAAQHILELSVLPPEPE
jgi:hypothetical protein